MPVRVALALLLLLAAGAMAWMAVYQVDDAFIVYRYAWNVANGHGFVFNPGERVEGVTCFLWTVALVPFSAASVDLPTVAPFLTGACGLLLLALVARRSAEADDRRDLAPRDLVPATVLGATPAFLYWSVGALETVPFALLVTLAVREHAREIADPARAGWRSALWAGLACLTRPEAPVIVAALALDRLLRRRQDLLRWGGIVAAFVVPFLLFRRGYFGDWLPNTYYAKTGAPLGVRLFAAYDYLAECAETLVPTFGATSTAITLGGVFVLVGLVVVAVRDPRWRPEGLVVGALVLATLFEGGDWMVLHRLFVPALPGIALVGSAAAMRLASRGRPLRIAASLLLMAWVANGALAATRERNGGRGLVVNAEGYRKAHLEIARYIAERARPGDAVALMDVGMVGWNLKEQRIVDITGLTHRAIAHAPGAFLQKEYPPSWVLSVRPKFLVLISGFPIDERLHADPEFASSYRFAFSVNHRFNWVPASAYNLNVFERVAP